MAELNSADKERKILEVWEQKNIFQKTLDLRRNKKRFVFFEGPPTANGLPHIGHFLTRVYKDLYGRYKTMQGFFVLRKAGWDTHGLPVEIEVEKELGFKNKKDIDAYGIDKFNKKARESVWRYKNEWEQMTKKMGFWVDMTDPYITYQNKYIESVWTIIKKIWDKNLLYLAHRVVPFCTRCGTPLSSHEVAQGYKKVKENSVYLKFKLKANDKFPENTFVLAWTTTPWTLPGNVALAVGKDIDYAVAELNGENYILADDLVKKVFSTDSAFRIQDSRLKGSDLVGLEYEPLFEVEKLKSDKSYKIYDADFVSTQDGTGVVHTAVMYGEDDYDLGTKIGLPKFHTVDEQGKFIGINPDLDGSYVKSKKTEELIIQKLESRNLVFKTEEYEHDYPFCWRCDTPLLYYAKESWFIKMSAVNKELLANNQKVDWFPGHIKDGRFGQWLKEGKDWAFSRERYWGTPLPIWRCADCDEKITAGSLDDLEKNRYRTKNEFFILRHGHSEKNGDGEIPPLVSSRLESDKYHLVQKGIEQIKKVAKQLKKMGLPGQGGIDVIISSPFIRTRETATIIANELGIEFKLDSLIGEIDHGSACEGKSEHVCEISHQEQEWETRTADGEDWKTVRRRMSQFLRDLDEKYEGKKILIISHGDPIWLLETFTMGLTKEDTIPTRNELFPHEGELKKVELKNWPYDDDGELDMHRPYVDRIILKCPKCTGKMLKVPDLIDVWFDSGAMPYAQWHWPFENEKTFKDQYPADFIVEAIDQTRGWFYTLLAIATLLDKGAPYKNVMVLGHTLDEKGAKMSKSKGNFVPVMELMAKYGADVLRWYFLSSVSAGESKSVIPREIEDKQKGFFGTLQNCLRFYELYSDKNSGLKPQVSNELDEWIMSRLHNLIAEVSDGLDGYDVTRSGRAIEKFVAEDLSNWWLRRSRKRKEAIGLLGYLLMEVAKLIAPFIPFTAEEIHQRLRGEKESIHLYDWPKANKKTVNAELEKQMENIRNIVAAGLAIRKEKQMKVRQPLRAALLNTGEFSGGLEQLLKEELNVKNIVYDNSQKETVILDLQLDDALRHEGYARELIRQIQDMRKEAKYRLDEKVMGQWHSEDEDLNLVLRNWESRIKEETILEILENYPEDEKSYDVEKKIEIAPGKEIWIGIWKKK